MRHADNDLQYVTFETAIGWIVCMGRGGVLTQLTAGLDSEHKVLAKLEPDLLAQAREARWCPELVKRLKAYAEGADDTFLDVKIDLEDKTPFQRRVIHHCRRIPLGETQSYGGLALLADAPRAARAVGSTMRGNRFPLIVPCHRVVNANGSLGNYSGPQGTQMKARLLELERRVAGLAARDRAASPKVRLSADAGVASLLAKLDSAKPLESV